MVALKPRGQVNRAAEESARREGLAQLVSALGKFLIQPLHGRSEPPLNLSASLSTSQDPTWAGGSMFVPDKLNQQYHCC